MRIRLPKSRLPRPSMLLEPLKRLLEELRAPRAYRDTLHRLIRGDFRDLTAEERRAKVEQIVQVAASAAMVLAAAPVPLLDLPVQAAMVRAVAKVHGVEGSERRLLLKLATALGLGFMLREALRLIPLAGGISHLSRVYGATWALGQAADFYFERAARAELPLDPEGARRRFEETLRRKSGEQAERFRASDALDRIKAFKAEFDSGRIGDAEFRARVESLLSGL